MTLHSRRVQTFVNWEDTKIRSCNRMLVLYILNCDCKNKMSQIKPLLAVLKLRTCIHTHNWGLATHACKYATVKMSKQE